MATQNSNTSSNTPTHALRLYYNNDLIVEIDGGLDSIELLCQGILKMRASRFDRLIGEVLERTNLDTKNIDEVDFAAHEFIANSLKHNNGTAQSVEGILIRIGSFLSYFVQAGCFPVDSIRIVDLATNIEEPMLLALTEGK